MGRCRAKIKDDRGIVYPFAVECIARQNPAVHRAAVISRQGRRLLVVELKENARAIAISLQESLARACIEKVAACQKIPVDKRPNANLKSENTCYK